jgi:hypothetical protein
MRSLEQLGSIFMACMKAWNLTHRVTQEVLSMTNRTPFALLAALALLSGGGAARAGQVLHLTGQYNPTAVHFSVNSTPSAVSGGGEISATLDGTAVDFMYCLQFSVDIYTNISYNNTTITADGTVQGGPLPFNSSLAGSGLDASREIAWLMVHEAQAAHGIGGDRAQEAGLQALIWQLVTPGFAMSTTLNSSAVLTAYHGYLADLQHAIAHNQIGDLRSSVLWITPSKLGNQSVYQAQVGYIPSSQLTAVPEPSAGILAISGLIPLGILARRLRRRDAGAA